MYIVCGWRIYCKSHFEISSNKIELFNYKCKTLFKVICDINKFLVKRILVQRNHISRLNCGYSGQR